MSLFTLSLISTLPGLALAGVLPGEDSTNALLPGQGINSASGEAAGHCVTLGSFTSQSGNATGQLAEFEMLEITSESSLRESLNISASGSLKFGVFGGGSARMNFSRSVNKNAQSRYLMVHTRVANQLELATSFKFPTSVLGLIQKTGGLSNDFYRQCGNEFVYGRRTGGEFFSVFEFEMHSDAENEAFSSAISASGMGWKVATEINRALEQFNLYSLSQVRTLRFGGSGAFPDVTSLQDYARKFPTMVQLSQGGAVTLELITKDYSGVEPLDKLPTTQDLMVKRYLIDQHAQRFDTAMEALNTIIAIRKNREAYRIDPKTHRLQQWENELSVYANGILTSAVSCLSNVWGDCRLPTHLSFPDITFPERKECVVERAPRCEVEGPNGCLVYADEVPMVCN